METSNSFNMTLGDVVKTLEKLNIDTTTATVSDIALALKIDFELASKIVESLKTDNLSKALEFFDIVKEKVDKNDDNGALFYLNKAIKFAPNVGLFYRERGYLKFLLKDKYGALIDLKKAKDLGDNDPNLDIVIEKCK